MDFNLTKEQEMLRKAVRDYAEREVAPRAAELDAKGEFPGESVREMGQLGFLGLVTAKQNGGSAMGHLARFVTIEEVSRVDPSLGFFFQTGNLLMYILDSYGNEEQKKKYLPLMCQGVTVSAMALTEQSGGSDPSGLTTSAVPVDGGYLVNGRKSFISNAAAADVLGFVCKTGEGFSVLLVEKGCAGYEVTRREPRAGLRAIPVNELTFTNCRLPRENLVGQEGKGLGAAISAIIVMGRTGAAGVALGIGQGAYEGALKFCKERVLYGKPILNLQALQFMLVDMGTEAEAARWLCYYAPWLLDQGKSVRDVGPEIARGKAYSVDMAVRNAQKAQQAMGAYGQAPEYKVERFLRDAMELLVAGGSQEIMRVTVGRAIGG